MVFPPYLPLAHINTAINDTVTAKYTSNSHLEIASHISCGPNFVSCCFALQTTVTAPATAITTPHKSRCRNLSLSMIGAITQLDISATTPRGDTMDAGANPYARKLPASPIVIKAIPAHQYGERRYVFFAKVFEDCVERREVECVVAASERKGLLRGSVSCISSPSLYEYS